MIFFAGHAARLLSKDVASNLSADEISDGDLRSCMYDQPWRNPRLRPKSAFPCFSRVHGADLEGRLRVDSGRSASGSIHQALTDRVGDGLAEPLGLAAFEGAAEPDGGLYDGLGQAVSAGVGEGKAPKPWPSPTTSATPVGASDRGQDSCDLTVAQGRPEIDGRSRATLEASRRSHRHILYLIVAFYT